MKTRTSHRGHAAESVLPQTVGGLLTAFAVGGVCGSLLMAGGGTVAQRLADALMNHSAPVAGRLLKIDALLLLAVFLSAFLRCGPALRLLAFCCKGLLMSAQVTACVSTLGGAGYGAAFAMVFCGGFLSTAALLLLAVQADGPVGRRVRGRSRPESAYFLAALLCALMTALAALAFYYLAPPMARTASAMLS